MITLFLLTSCLLPFASCLNNGLGLTPQMGWNSWNHFHCGINEQLIKQTADAMVSSGLLEAGYNYLNLDDCWAKSRSTEGVVQPDPKDFPNGMKSLADYVHSKGLKFGVYSDAGTETCAGRPGSLDHEEIDAKTYAEWGVDYLKYDNCHSNGSKPEVRYPIMRDALNKTGRPIFFSMCEWGVDNPATWAPEVGNSWRTTGDIRDSWGSMLGNADKTEPLWKYAGPGAWNDPDMLEIGNGHMSTDEYIVHFSLWALMKAPLLIGCDVTKTSNDTLMILKNPEVINISQDALGAQGHRVFQDATKGVDVWAGPLKDKSMAVILLNRADANTTQTITVNFHEHLNWPTGTKAVPRDLWKHQTMPVATDMFTAQVGRHSAVMVRLTPQ